MERVLKRQVRNISGEGNTRQQQKPPQQQNELLFAELQSYSFFRLSYLVIECCTSLTTFPQCPKLEKLELRVGISDKLSLYYTVSQFDTTGVLQIDNNGGYINSLPAECFQHLSHLNLVEIENMKKLITGEAGKVFRTGRASSSLRTINIANCSNMKRLPRRGMWEHLNAAESLQLMNLDKLELDDEVTVDVDTAVVVVDEVPVDVGTAAAVVDEVPIDVGTAVVVVVDDVPVDVDTAAVVVDEDVDDADMPWRCLAPTLRSLQLLGLPKLVKLPKGMQHLTALQFLHISNCENLEALTPSIGCLLYLQFLYVESCKKLKSLPEEMRHLTS